MVKSSARRHRRRALICGTLVGGLLLGGGEATAAQHALGARPPVTIVKLAPASKAAVSLPAEVDLRAWSMPVGDQGAVGSCVAWAFAYNLAGWYARRMGMFQLAFAPMFMYSQIVVGTDGGSYPRDALALGEATGNEPWADYWQGAYDWSTPPSPTQLLSASHYRFVGPRTLAADPSGGMGGGLSSAIKASLANAQPVAIMFPVRPGFDHPTPEPDGGAAVDRDTTGTIRGYHEVIAFGYDETGLIVENQWGESWGSFGFARLAWDVVARDVVEADVISGIQRANVFFADASQGNALTNLTFDSTQGWQQRPMGASAVATGSSPAPVESNGQPYVFYADASHGNTMSYRNYPRLLSGWSGGLLGGDRVASTTSPTAVNLGGSAHVFYVDATQGDTLAEWWRGQGSSTWRPKLFLGHRVAPGSSPSAVMFQGRPHVFFADAANGNTLTVLARDKLQPRVLDEGALRWSEVPMYGDPVAAGTSPSAVVSGDDLYVFFVDASRGNTLSVWKWSSAGALTQTLLLGHAVAAGSSPGAIAYGPKQGDQPGAPNALFVDAANGNTLSRWSLLGTLGWEQTSLAGDPVMAASSPSVIVAGPTLHAFFADALRGGTLTDWICCQAGWQLPSMLGNPLTTGSSPAATS